MPEGETRLYALNDEFYDFDRYGPLHLERFAGIYRSWFVNG